LFPHTSNTAAPAASILVVGLAIPLADGYIAAGATADRFAVADHDTRRRQAVA
jgi:hypothetical protein